MDRISRNNGLQDRVSYERIIWVVAGLRNKNDRNRATCVAFQAGSLRSSSLRSFWVVKVSSSTFLMLFTPFCCLGD